MRGTCWVMAAVAVMGLAWGAGAQEDAVRVYIGTYTGPKSQGIYMLKMDPNTGKLSEPVLAGEVKNPSFLAIHPSQRFLYAVGELDNFQGKKGGAISAFSIDPASGKLTLINQQTSGGGGAVLRDGGRDGEGGAAGELRRGERGVAADQGGRFAGGAGDVRAARGVGGGPAAAEGAARALDQLVAGQPVRVRGVPGAGQGTGVPVRRGNGEAGAARPGVRGDAGGGAGRGTSRSTRTGGTRT